jgi:hypothetical protein
MYKPDPAEEKIPGYRKWTGKWWWIGTLTFGFLLAVFLWGQAANAGPTAPGSESDPLVTESWVKAYFSQALKEEQNKRQLLEERLQKLEAGGVERPLPEEPGDPAVPAAGFEIVTVASGEKLLTGSGTEMILRSGRAKVLAGPGGGLSDLTAGCNLSTGDPVKADHLLLSSRDDGRGVVLESQAILLVRGGYKVE